MTPSLGYPERVASDVRIVVSEDGERELFGVEVKFEGFENWQRHCPPTESYSAAMKIARKVARREKQTRDNRDWTPEGIDCQPDNRSWLRSPDQVTRHGPDKPNLPTMGLKIRQAAKARGLRWYSR